MRTHISCLALVFILLLTLATGCDGGTERQNPVERSELETSTVRTKASVGIDDNPHSAELDAADFQDEVDNRYFPLKPGARWVYETTKEDGVERNEVVVIPEKREILGIDATVVHDTVKVNGALREDTYDWYAQEQDGTVWYLGEDTKEIEDGKTVSTEGSWEAGKDGAQPGVIIQSDQRPGGWYWQEYYKGEAEDQARIVSREGSEEVPVGRWANLLVTEERSPLEPEIVSRKYYALGIGLILERTVKGPKETSVLTGYEIPD